MTLNLGNGNQNLVCEHFLTLVYVSLKFHLICFSRFWVNVDTRSVRDEPMALTLVVLDTLPHYALPFCEVWLNFLYQFFRYGWHKVRKWQTYNLQLWPLPRLRYLDFVRNTPSHFALPFYEVWLNYLYCYVLHTICKWQIYDLQLWPWPSLWNYKFCHDTPSYFVLPFCELWWSLHYWFLVTADTWLVSDKPITCNSDLDLPIWA